MLSSLAKFQSEFLRQIGFHQEFHRTKDLDPCFHGRADKLNVVIKKVRELKVAPIPKLVDTRIYFISMFPKQMMCLLNIAIETAKIVLKFNMTFSFGINCSKHFA